MPSEKDDLIRLLEAELDLIEGGGYGQPAGKPAQEKPMFYESLACINHWLIPGRRPECNEDCVLMQWVPEQHRKETHPCHFIRLNDKGDTVHSLEGNQDRLEEAVKSWLRTTIHRLREENDATPGRFEVKF